MHTSVKALIASTLAGIGPTWAWWTAWAVLAAGTVAIVALGRRPA